MMDRKAMKTLEGKELEYYNLLMSAREEVCGQIRQYSENALDVSNSDKRGVTTHMADISSDNTRHEMELQLLSEDGDVLKLIDAAIDRLHKGTYGRCLDCNQMIPEGRLQVRPYAIYCIKCKSKREEQQKY